MSASGASASSTAAPGTAPHGISVLLYSDDVTVRDAVRVGVGRRPARDVEVTAWRECATPAAVIEGMGGKVLKVDNWGKRRLAYEVAKERKGIYLYWRYLATSGVVEETERNLRMLDNVIRFLTIRVDENIVPDARPSELDDTSYERAATTAADEEDLFLSRPSDSSDADDEFGGFEDGDVVPGAARRKVCRFCAETTTLIDYKNPQLLKHFLSDRGKVVPARISGVSARQQRQITRAIKRA